MASLFKWIGLADDGLSVTLQKFNGQFRLAPYATDDWLEANAALVGRSTGELLRLITRYAGFEDPNEPLSEPIKRLTGISDDDVRGQKINWDLINEELRLSEIVVAHNAGFDRSFIDGKCPASSQALWG